MSNMHVTIMLPPSADADAGLADAGSADAGSADVAVPMDTEDAGDAGDAGDADEVEVERVLDSHVSTLGTSYLLRWVGYGPEHDEWVAAEDCNCDELVAAYWAEADGAGSSDDGADACADDSADDDATAGADDADDADDASVDADGN